MYFAAYLTSFLPFDDTWNINSSLKKDHSKGLSEAQKHEKSLPGSSIVWWECLSLFSRWTFADFSSMTIYISTYSSDIEDGGDCDDNFVKAPLSNNITGNDPIIEVVILSMHKHQRFWDIYVRSWNPFKDALPDWTKSCKSNSWVKAKNNSGSDQQSWRMKLLVWTLTKII